MKLLSWMVPNKPTQIIAITEVVRNVMLSLPKFKFESRRANRPRKKNGVEMLASTPLQLV
jgi:hypothetical protein